MIRFGKKQNNPVGMRRVVWKTPNVTADGLKIFACAVMLIQSAGIVIVENGLIDLSQYTQAELSKALASSADLMTLAGIGSMMQIIGGLGVPIFAFLLVEGFLHTSSYRKYLLTMLLFALLSEIPYDLAMYRKVWDFTGQNALFSMIICLLMLYFLRMARERKGFLSSMFQGLIVLTAVFWVSFFRMNCGLCLVLLTAVFYLFYSRNVLKTVLGVLISLLYVTGPLSFYGLWCYNEVRTDRFPKYAYYVFYPLHLLILAAVTIIFL